MPILSNLRSRLAKLLAQDPSESTTGQRVAVSKQKIFRPSVRKLEPRFVLNASAELTALGQLVITGTDAADYVRMEVNSLGQITLENEFGAPIDIVGNPNGQSAPLNPSDIFSKQIQINLLGGNDTLDLAIPSGINVSVVDGEGFDNIKVIRPDSTLANESATHQLAAQSIRFDDSPQPLDWRNQHFQLTGDVYVGTTLSTSSSEILIDGGSWEVSGRLILQGDVNFVSNALGGSLDLSGATLTADEPLTTLTFDLGSNENSFLSLGNLDGSGSERIENINVLSAHTVKLQSATFDLPGELNIQNVSESLEINAQISAAEISIQASAIRALDASLTTESGNISIDGPIHLLGDLQVNTASGDITVTDLIDGNHNLAVNAGTGTISLQSDVGRIESLSTIDLTGSMIHVHSLSVIDGDIKLEADDIQLAGARIETLLSGDVLFVGPVTVHAQSVDIRSSGSVHFQSTIVGKLGTEVLSVNAQDDIYTIGSITNIDSVSLEAQKTIRLMSLVEVNRDFSAVADNLIVEQNISTNASSDGAVNLSGTTNIALGPDTEIEVGTGSLTTTGPITFLGDLSIAAQGGNILLASSIDGQGVLNLTNLGGNTVIQDSIGGVQPLAGVNIQSGQLSVDTVVVRDSSILLTADEIGFTGQTITTLDSGNIVINGDLIVTRDTSTIVSADSVQLNGTVRGRDGSENLAVTADQRIDLADGAENLNSLSLLASDTIQTEGAINVAQDFTAIADTLIINGDITLPSDSTGTISLQGKDLVQVGGSATLSMGSGTLSIVTQGTVDLANANIQSDSTTATAEIRGASIITLGNVDLPNGLLDMQTMPLSTATISQAAGTSVTVSSLRIVSGGDVTLQNANNDFQLLEDLNVRGNLLVRDDFGDLTIGSTLVLGTQVDIVVNGTLYLLDNAIFAQQADILINAAMAVVNVGVDPTQDNITGSTLVMTASTGVGLLKPIYTRSIESFDVVTTDGGINIQQRTLTDTTIQRLVADTGLVKLEQFGEADLLIGSISSGRDGVTIINHAGSVDLVVSPSGGSTITGGEFGRISIEADQFIRMPDGSRIDADRGTISLLAIDDVILGGLKTIGSQPNAIEITSLTGSIIDGGDEDIDINANDGGVILNAFSGIGHGNPLETAIDRLSASVTSTGTIHLVERDAIDLVDVVTNDGFIQIVADGTITATRVLSANVFDIDDRFGTPLTRDVMLQARGETSDILVHQITATGSADVLLIAGDDILGISDGTTTEVVADDLELVAGNLTDDGVLAIQLRTDINELLLTVNGTSRGDAEIRELNSVMLASSDLLSDNHQLRTNNGEIRIFAGDSLTILDRDESNDSTAPLADPEIVAGGANGRIVLVSENKVELGNEVQIVAAQSTPGAVKIESTSVIFGESIEINTGSGIGIAKFFLPRPATDEMDTAFYDSTTIRTDTLTQENAKDAKGFLTVKVGLPGERGLQVDIDWGAPTNRFQRITDISADNSRLVDGSVDVTGPLTDEPLLQVSHVYLESDILNSVFNGRTSATGPLNVRFSVSHHDSIVVQADRVTQGFDETAAALTAEIPGRLVSSTDNPSTAGLLESGTARFIIPNLSIPVAFFPVREIIPEPIQLETLARPVESVLISSGSVESESGSVSSFVTRDEYFQIRILSPDPFGEDLAEPKRLPDDILAGDKLKKLFEDLPDGRYEIGYVVGDGNVRSLLMIDNRDGVTKVLGQEIEGGPLRLERLSVQDIQDLPVEELPKPPDADPDDELPEEMKDGDTDMPTPEDQGRINPDGSGEVPFNPLSRVGRFLAKVATQS